jgi:uncharacterized protein (TIGR02246 family)
MSAPPSATVTEAEHDAATQTTYAFASALLARDAAAALAYFAPEARLLTPDGTEVCGRAAITNVLEQLTASSQKLEIKERRTVRVGAIALCSQRWTIRSESGEAFERSFHASFVLQRLAGRWALLIAAPWG